jgi:hypothetical protein
MAEEKLGEAAEYAALQVGNKKPAERKPCLRFRSAGVLS